MSGVGIGVAGSVAPVVIEFSNPNSAAIQKLEEDLAIMAHILGQALDRGLGQEPPPSRMGVPLLYTSSGRSIHSMYLEGFGALFTVKVNMPLLAPPSPGEPKPAENAADSEWESARREVLGQGERGSMGPAAANPETPFDAEQVETLKRTLVEALKNAANIRDLKSDDVVSIAVFGQPITPMPGAPMAIIGNIPAPPMAGVSHSEEDDEAIQTAPVRKAPGALPALPKPSRRPSGRSMTTGRYGSVSGGYIAAPNAFLAGSASQNGTVLTLRAKKSDIDAFAQGKMDLESFTRTVPVNVYAGNSYGTGASSSQGSRSALRAF